MTAAPGNYVTVDNMSLWYGSWARIEPGECIRDNQPLKWWATDIHNDTEGSRRKTTANVLLVENARIGREQRPR